LYQKSSRYWLTLRFGAEFDKNGISHETIPAASISESPAADPAAAPRPAPDFSRKRVAERLGLRASRDPAAFAAEIYLDWYVAKWNSCRLALFFWVQGRIADTWQEHENVGLGRSLAPLRIDSGFSP